jgi:hypothetical protein
VRSFDAAATGAFAAPASGALEDSASSPFESAPGTLTGPAHEPFGGSGSVGPLRARIVIVQSCDRTRCGTMVETDNNMKHRDGYAVPARRQRIISEPD